MLKWSITIGEKPRGMWRPKITMHIWDDEPENPLNILTIFNCTKVYTGGCSRRTCGSCTSCPLRNGQNVVPEGFTRTNLKFFTSASGMNPEVIKGCDCNNTSRIYELVENIDLRDFTFELYPEWRPGYPDYSDYVEFLRDTYCMPAMEEYNRRLNEALASPSMNAQTISSDSGSFSSITEGGTKVQPTRRLKVAG